MFKQAFSFSFFLLIRYFLEVCNFSNFADVDIVISWDNHQHCSSGDEFTANHIDSMFVTGHIVTRAVALYLPHNSPGGFWLTKSLPAAMIRINSDISHIPMFLVSIKWLSSRTRQFAQSLSVTQCDSIISSRIRNFSAVGLFICNMIDADTNPFEALDQSDDDQFLGPGERNFRKIYMIFAPDSRSVN